MNKFMSPEVRKKQSQTGKTSILMSSDATARMHGLVSHKKLDSQKIVKIDLNADQDFGADDDDEDMDENMDEDDTLVLPHRGPDSAEAGNESEQIILDTDNDDEDDDFDEDHVGEEDLPRKDALRSAALHNKSTKIEKGSKSRSRRRKAAARISVNQSSISVAQALGHKTSSRTKANNFEIDFFTF